MAERPKEMDELLCEPRMARIATVSPRNVPHIVPVVYIFDPEEGSFFISTGADSVTAKNLNRNPAITVCIDDAEFPLRAVIIEGEAEVSEPLGTDHEGIKIVVDQFFGPDMWESYKDGPVAQKIRVRLNIVPKKWKFWDYRRNLNGVVKIG